MNNDTSLSNLLSSNDYATDGTKEPNGHFVLYFTGGKFFKMITSMNEMTNISLAHVCCFVVSFPSLAFSDLSKIFLRLKFLLELRRAESSRVK